MRYFLLVGLSLPILIVSLLNIIVSYKTKKLSGSRLKHQLVLWCLLVAIVIGAFPVYNLLNSRPIFTAELSIFEILQITAIVYLIWVANGQRQHIEQNRKDYRDLHSELAIRLSENDLK